MSNSAGVSMDLLELGVKPQKFYNPNINEHKQLTTFC